MNYLFSLSDDGLVVETKWVGALTGEIIATGVEERKAWIEANAKGEPRILLSDYTEADVDQLTTEGLRLIASKFKGVQERMPHIHWISIVPTDAKYGLARMWQVYAEEHFKNSHVVRNRTEADKLIASLIR